MECSRGGSLQQFPPPPASWLQVVPKWGIAASIPLALSVWRCTADLCTSPGTACKPLLAGGHDRFCPPSLKHGAHPRNHNGEPSVLTSCSQSPKQRSEPAFPLP